MGVYNYLYWKILIEFQAVLDSAVVLPLVRVGLVIGFLVRLPVQLWLTLP